MTDIKEELRRVGWLPLANMLLFCFTIIPAILLLLYGIGIYYMLGVFAPPVYGPFILVIFLTSMFFLYQTAPGKERKLPLLRGYTRGFDPQTAAWQDPNTGAFISHDVIRKEKICRFCGVEFAGETCEICGRKFCDTCMSKNPALSTGPLKICPECITCPVCREKQVTVSCMMCGKWVCGGCFTKGACIECSPITAQPNASTRKKAQAWTVILEPSQELSNMVCDEITPHVRSIHQNSTLQLGSTLDILGAQFKVAAVNPVTKNDLVIGPTTVLSLVNRTERDNRLRNIRKNSGWPICYVENCDFAIARKCISCNRIVCPNHSGFCQECGKIICQKCVTQGLCVFCLNVSRTGKMPKPTAREILTTLGKAYFYLPITIIFLAIFYYGNKLGLNPFLRLVFSIGIIITGPLLAITYLIYRTLKKPPQNG